MFCGVVKWTQQAKCLYLKRVRSFNRAYPGWTAAALIVILPTVCSMLSTNTHVHVFALDFTKAFDNSKTALSWKMYLNWTFQTQSTTGWSVEQPDTARSSLTNYQRFLQLQQASSKDQDSAQLHVWLPHMTYPRRQQHCQICWRYLPACTGSKLKFLLWWTPEHSDLLLLLLLLLLLSTKMIKVA